MYSKTVTVILILTIQAFAQVKDVLTPLPANSIHFHDYFEKDIHNSIDHWNKGVVPYSHLVDFQRKGRPFFALGEMWGKSVRSACMFYRYTQDPELKKIIEATVKDMLSTKRENGSFSCVPVASQPDGKGGDLWERKYVLLGLDEYYTQIKADTAILNAMIGQADCIIAQIGPSPKVRIVDQGWSSNHIESSSLLEPFMRLYKLTHYQRYLDFAKYIVETEGGSLGYNIFEAAYNNVEPYKMAGTYPKAYEMTSIFEGLVEYYRITGNERWKQVLLNYYNNVRTKEITLVGNGGSDRHYPEVYGEAWGNTTAEQTDPDIKRMMETCVGVTWLKYCSQILRLTGDPSAVDEIEKYIYNGLIGAMKPEGDGFSYVNLLNGVKTNKQGWGTEINGVYVTCCNLNGPMGLAYIPYIAVMNSKSGPAINLYNAGHATASTPANKNVDLNIKTDFPRSGEVTIFVNPASAEKFSIKLRIPSWSKETLLKVNGKKLEVVAGSYKEIERTWNKNDKIELSLDMRTRLIDAPKGSKGDMSNYKAVVRGPIVLARDESIDSTYNMPVEVISNNGFVKIVPEKSSSLNIRMQYKVPTKQGSITMVDYSSVNSWEGKKVCTWLPMLK